LAFTCAAARGIELVVAAVIGPNSTVLTEPADVPVRLSRVA
jgi:hypothetical protein